MKVDRQKLHIVAVLLLSLLMCVSLPMIGAVLSGEAAAKYLEFPPRTHYVEHAPYRVGAFWLVAVLELVFLYLPLAAVLIKTAEIPPLARRGFPWWGWLGIVAGAVSWGLAWTRFPWFAGFQRHTFSPLWLSYIVVVNAVSFWRGGRCMLTDTPRFFLLLFPVSAAFWWLFEYLNRFVQNWYYVGIDDLSAAEYFWLATLPYSTVLPAVLGTYNVLTTFLGDTPLVLERSGTRRREALATLMLALAVFGLLGIGLWSNFLFPLLWIAPLLVLSALMELAGEDSLLFHLPSRGMKRLALLASAALICGFFWEMWNYCSLAKWVYEVP
ncbi:MAG TPA: hypothetical protein EYP62_00040, partial [Kiritimatiellae bacterium]|nr:hypothetical protein [Kiritimatiellia bacterium]